ncbi:hypothetical protein Tco_0191224 [Tanacetum coccineum]
MSTTADNATYSASAKDIAGADSFKPLRRAFSWFVLENVASIATLALKSGLLDSTNGVPMSDNCPYYAFVQNRESGTWPDEKKPCGTGDRKLADPKIMSQGKSALVEYPPPVFYLVESLGSIVPLGKAFGHQGECVSSSYQALEML